MGPSPAQHEAVMAAHRAEHADVLLVDPAFAGAAFVLGYPRAERPAVVVCGVLPLSLSSRDTAPYGLAIAPMAGGFGRLRNSALASLAGRVLAPAERRADEMYREVHGVDMPGAVLDWSRRADAIAQFTVAEFEYPRSDAPDTLHFVGPISAPGSTAPRPDWWAELDGSKPVVHVTQGTFANKDFGQLVGPTLEALADEDVLVVVATGGRPLETLPPLPANARAAEFLPYDELLPKTDVYVTNAGLRRRAVRAAPRRADRRERRAGGQARGRRADRLVGRRPAHPSDLAEAEGAPRGHPLGPSRRALPARRPRHGRPDGRRRGLHRPRRHRRPAGRRQRPERRGGRPHHDTRLIGDAEGPSILTA